MYSLSKVTRQPAAITCFLGLLATAFMPTLVHATPKGHKANVLKQVPPGAQKIVYGKSSYYFHNGRFYRHGNGRYVPVRPPAGLVIKVLPSAAVAVVAGGITYYHYDTVYYRKIPAGYEVVELTETAAQEIAAPSLTVPVAVGTRVSVRVDTLNVRSGPGKEHSVTAVVRYGRVLVTRGNAPGWIYVELPDGRYGWVMVQFISPIAAEAKG